MHLQALWDKLLASLSPFYKVYYGLVRFGKATTYCDLFLSLPVR